MIIHSCRQFIALCDFQLIIDTWYWVIAPYDDVIKWKHFPRYWPFVRGIHRTPHKGQWRGALMFSFIWAKTIRWVNNRDAGNLRGHRAHHEVTLMWWEISCLLCPWRFMYFFFNETRNKLFNKHPDQFCCSIKTIVSGHVTDICEYRL